MITQRPGGSARLAATVGFVSLMAPTCSSWLTSGLCPRGTHRVSRACSRNPECSYVGQILYSFSRSGMSSLATPEIVPLKPPVAAKKTGLPRASAATVFTVSVIVRTPDA